MHPVLTLPEVRVVEERPALDARHRQPTGFVSDVRAGDTGHAFETVAELLSRTAAVRIQQYGGLGSFATVSLRGAAASQLAVYLDGVPLNSAAGSVYNFFDHSYPDPAGTEHRQDRIPQDGITFRLQARYAF